jgi:hypothetical protein
MTTIKVVKMAKNKGINWPIILTALLVAYALLADWVSKNPVVGWTVIVCVTLIAIFILIRFSTLRTKIFKAAKDGLYTCKANDKAKVRIPIPKATEVSCFKRAKNICENPNCNNIHGLELHHINGDPSFNHPKNLAVLCPSCHELADRGSFRRVQVESWVYDNFKKQGSQR